jgi:predicted RecA/RadA family phage recombinase
MATDYWPDEEGYIYEGCMVLPCKAAAVITEGYLVLLSATAAGVITVTQSAGAVGDTVAVALRAANTGDFIPCAFSGVVKLVAGCTIALHDAVIGGTTAGKVVVNCSTFDGAAASYRLLGMALQAGGTTGDEILVLLKGGP